MFNLFRPKPPAPVDAVMLTLYDGSKVYRRVAWIGQDANVLSLGDSMVKLIPGSRVEGKHATEWRPIGDGRMKDYFYKNRKDRALRVPVKA